MKKIAKLLINPIYKKYQDLLFRVSDLEFAVDYLIESPKYIDSDDSGFNGQKYRKQIFETLMSEIGFEIIVETGTWTGNTTGYMARKTKVPVYTVEKNKKFQSIAKMRLKDFDNITFELGDSPVFLNKLSNTNITKKNTFFYLDAHWNKELPLKDEIEIISNNWRKFVIMIDDFRVPGDDGYGYDNYGEGKSLTLETFLDLFSKCGLISFFPVMSSVEETGGKRGCIILVKDREIMEKLNSIRLLYLYHKNLQYTSNTV